MRNLLVLFSTVFLAGCVASAQNATHGMYERAASEEGLSWASANDRIMVECGDYNDKNPLPPSKAIEVGKCREEIIRQVVMPKSYSPLNLNQYLIEASKIRYDYSKNRIDRETAIIKDKEAYAKYLVEFESSYKDAMSQAYQADISASQGQSQALMNAGQTLMTEPNSFQQNCNAISVAPLARPGCKNICINGGWSEVCG